MKVSISVVFPSGIFRCYSQRTTMVAPEDGDVGKFMTCEFMNLCDTNIPPLELESTLQ